MDKTLNKLRDLIHENAKEKGFYDSHNSIINQLLPAQIIQFKHTFFAQQVALIHSELSEALEADRHICRADMERYDKMINGLKKGYAFKSERQLFESIIKNTVEDELADSLIRILDLCGYLGIDIDKHVELKMKYNSEREYLHGKSY